MRRNSWLLGLIVAAACASAASAAVIQIGPARTYTTVQAGYNAANDGDTIEIDSGTYTGSSGWVVIYKNNLTIRGVGATRPVLDAAGGATASKGIFVVYSGNLVVENLEFRNAWISYSQGLNAAGIRYQPSVFPAKLTARGCVFRDNQNGVLTDGGSTTDVEFDSCEFVGNGAGDGYSHNMYIGNLRTFTIKHCYSHGTNEGHEVKTRAVTNHILYNLIDSDNTGSRELQIANGGTAYIIGNVVRQGAGSHNPEIITYGDEGANPNPYLYIVNNTLINQRANGATFLQKSKSTNACIFQNNIVQWYGYETIISGSGVSQVTNWTTTNAQFANPAAGDYRLTVGSTGAIDAGTAPGVGYNSYSLLPVYQYVHPFAREDRPAAGTIDIGAYEYVVANQDPTVDTGADTQVVEGESVSLTASGSDPDEDPLTYAWTQTAGKSVSLTGANSATCGFAAPVVASLAEANLAFEVTVEDGRGGSASDTVSVRVYLAGDIDRDDAVNVFDIFMIAESWNTQTGDPAFNADADLDGDGAINVFDIFVIAENWNRTLN